MDQLCIRHAFEDKVRELGGKVLGAGCLMVPPFTMYFDFTLDGREYLVTLKKKNLTPEEESATPVEEDVIEGKEAGNAD
ncbi:MAG: hypothetical protein LBP29_08775 [Treponema sp.]|jgi:hypothetical protein|nr:hypothetical protein [Treponema sp.]